MKAYGGQASPGGAFPLSPEEQRLFALIREAVRPLYERMDQLEARVDRDLQAIAKHLNDPLSSAPRTYFYPRCQRWKISQIL